jgi:predicted metal-dependent hydrolase
MSQKLETIKKFYVRAFEALNGSKKQPEIDVRFYPYIGINHTIRIREGKVFVRIGTVCEDAPFEVQESLAHILVSKLLRKRLSTSISAVYKQFSKSTELREKAIDNKRENGRKVITTSKGNFYDLDQTFERLNLLYFENKVAKPTLSWSKGKTFRILGHHDATHETIIVSKSLDDKNVPQYVVEYIVFHEMLHIVHPVYHKNGRRFIHTPKFRRDERSFAYFNEAEKWIDQNISSLKRKARRK